MHDTGCAIGCSWMRMQQDSCWRSQYRSEEALLVCKELQKRCVGGRGGIQGRSGRSTKAAEETRRPLLQAHLASNMQQGCARQKIPFSPFSSKPPGEVAVEKATLFSLALDLSQ